MNKFIGFVAAFAWVVGVAACVAGPGNESDPSDADDEETGSAEEALGGVGDSCYIWRQPPDNCISTLACCGNALTGGHCRNLLNDESNCGTCGNVCGGPNPTCFNGHCV